MKLVDESTRSQERGNKEKRRKWCDMGQENVEGVEEEGRGHGMTEEGEKNMEE